MTGLYEKYVLPKLIDAACSQPPMTELRSRYVSQAKGDVLEIGIGSGLNLRQLLLGLFDFLEQPETNVVGNQGFHFECPGFLPELRHQPESGTIVQDSPSTPQIVSLVGSRIRPPDQYLSLFQG